MIVCPKPTFIYFFVAICVLKPSENIKQYSPSHAHVEVWKYRWRPEERLQAVTTYTFLRRPNTAWEKTIPGNLEVHLTDFTNCFLFRTVAPAQWTQRIHHWALTFHTGYWIINWALKNEPKSVSQPLRMKLTGVLSQLVSNRIPLPLSLMYLTGFCRILLPQSGEHAIFLHFLINHISKTWLMRKANQIIQFCEFLSGQVFFLEIILLVLWASNF